MNGPDGITDAHRGAWDRLSRFHLASTALPDRTTFLHESDAKDARSAS